MSRRRPATSSRPEPGVGRSKKQSRARRRPSAGSGARRGTTKTTALGPRPATPRAAAASKKASLLTPLSKVVLSVALVVTGVTFAGQWLLRQSFFRVQHVTITGLHHEKYATVLASSGLSRHPTMLGLSAASVRHNLRHFTWISGVTIQKRWPNSVTLSIQESRAVAAAFTSHHVLDYVDAHGRDLGQAPLHVNLPTLVYLRPSSATWPFARAGRAAAVVAAELPPAFSSQVSKITVGAAGNVTIELTTPLSFYLGPATNLHAKFVAIASVIGHATLKPGDVVNVTVPDELSVSGPTPQ